MGLCLAGFIGSAKAADDMVLFKIHDIAPVKNADGLISACEFGATFYNRTGLDVSNVDLKLTWEDDTLNQIKDDEKKNAIMEENDDGYFSMSKYNANANANTGEEVGNPNDVTMGLRLPPLKAYKQISLKSKVNTDKCFLLMGDVKVDVSSCKKGETEVTICRDLFKYVSVKDAEYYTDFQVISADELKSQEVTLEQQQKQELSVLFDKALASINGIAEKLK